jgi:hypothetical protein
MNVCSHPEECCKELSRVWEALGVTHFVPGRGSCSEQVFAIRLELERLKSVVSEIEKVLTIRA